jgi:hypothetical protein
VPEQRSPDGKRADNPYQPAPIFSRPLHALHPVFVLIRLNI